MDEQHIEGGTAENLEKAIAGYQKALLVYTKETSPSDWAKTQNNLGIAYSDRIGGKSNIEKAIASPLKNILTEQFISVGYHTN